VRLASRCRMVARHCLALVIVAGSAVRRSGFRVYSGAGALRADRGFWAGVSLVRRNAGAELNTSPHGTCTRPRYREDNPVCAVDGGRPLPLFVLASWEAAAALKVIRQIMSSTRWPRTALGRFLPRSVPTPGCKLQKMVSLA